MISGARGKAMNRTQKAHPKSAVRKSNWWDDIIVFPTWRGNSRVWTAYLISGEKQEPISLAPSYSVNSLIANIIREYSIRPLVYNDSELKIHMVRGDVVPTFRRGEWSIPQHDDPLWRV